MSHAVMPLQLSASNGSDTYEGDVLQLQNWIYSQRNEGLGEYGPAKYYKKVIISQGYISNLELTTIPEAMNKIFNLSILSMRLETDEK